MHREDEYKHLANSTRKRGGDEQNARTRNHQTDRAVSFGHIFGDADAQCRHSLAQYLSDTEPAFWNRSRVAELLRSAFQRRKHCTVDVNGERGLLHRSGKGDQEVQGR
jgi:hypothetical protein